MKNPIIIFLLFVFATNTLNAQSDYLIKENKLSTSIFMEYSVLNVEYWSPTNKKICDDINSGVIGVNANMNLNKSFDLVGAVGLSKGFNYRFATSNLALKLSQNFNVNFGCGLYVLDDDKWNPSGLDGNDPSNLEFGLNLGLACQITKSLGISIKYNMIEGTEEEGVSSMSLNGFAFGVTLR